MSHLYYAYGAENAAGSPPSVHAPHAAHRRSPQAWSADPRRAPAQLPISQFTELSASPPQSLSAAAAAAAAAAAMNSARPIAPASHASPYEDNLFHMMGKAFADPSQPQPTSSPLPRPAPQQQPSFTQPHPTSTVFDPSDFPSLGAVGAHAAMQPSATSILDNNAPIDHNLTTASLSAPTLNGIAPYQDLYSLGAYADSRVKAVDALTGSSAPSEFSMQSEDFPALGGAPASATLRPVNASSAIANGAYQLDGSSMRSSLQKAPLSDSFYDRRMSSVSSQPTASVLGRVNVRQDAASRMTQRSTRLPNGFTASDALSSLQLHHAANLNVTSQHALRDLASTSPRRGATSSSASNGAQLFQMRARQGELGRRMDEYEGVDSREATSRQNVFTQSAKASGVQESRFSRSRMANGRAANNSEAHAVPTGSRASAVNDGNNSNASGAFRSDKFGMLSLLPLVCSGGNVSRKDRVLPIGIDLTALGLNLNSHEPLYKTFHNPWEGGQGRASESEFGGAAQKRSEPEYRLPTCYYMQAPALRSSHFSKFQLETLFYIFYIMPHDVLQLLAAVELYNRKWRYHKALKLWFTRDVDGSSGYEGGYSYFDIKSWGKREFHEVNDNQSFIKGFMTEEELASVKIPPL